MAFCARLWYTLGKDLEEIKNKEEILWEQWSFLMFYLHLV